MLLFGEAEGSSRFDVVSHDLYPPFPFHPLAGSPTADRLYEREAAGSVSSSWPLRKSSSPRIAAGKVSPRRNPQWTVSGNTWPHHTRVARSIQHGNGFRMKQFSEKSIDKIIEVWCEMVSYKILQITVWFAGFFFPNLRPQEASYETTFGNDVCRTLGRFRDRGMFLGDGCEERPYLFRKC
jgi:hypothetical protein